MRLSLSLLGTLFRRVLEAEQEMPLSSYKAFRSSWDYRFLLLQPIPAILKLGVKGRFLSGIW